MTREQIYQAWAPDEGTWSPWAKPVLFAHLPASQDAMADAYDAPAPWAPAPDGSAIVVDLPGAGGVWCGLGLARLGYRPVPLYNACPPGGAVLAGVVIDLEPIMLALTGGAALLSRVQLPADAPPAFLLDARRRHVVGVYPTPGMFDNRSVSLPTDFPSGTRLLSLGIRRVILVQENRIEPQEDLSHTLVRWQEAGIEIAAQDVLQPGPAITIEVSRPKMYRVLWQRLLAIAGLRRSPFGGFGGRIPIPSSGG